jgi:DNA polymerase V
MLNYFFGEVSAGVPSAAYDDAQQPLDLHQLLVPHPAATFFIRVEGNSMRDAQIQSGDLLIVDRSLTPQDGRVVVALIQGEFTVKRLKKIKDRLYLEPANKRYRAIDVTDMEDFQIWGVVTYVIHRTG